jgi:hypothetical protein
VEAFGATDYEQALAQRCGSLAVQAYPLSVYVHIPFCESLCYYCACNKIITKHHERGAEYLKYLATLEPEYWTIFPDKKPGAQKTATTDSTKSKASLAAIMPAGN